MAGWLTDRGPQAKEALISSLRQQLEAAQQEVALQAAKAASLQVCPPPATCRSNDGDVYSRLGYAQARLQPAARG